MTPPGTTRDLSTRQRNRGIVALMVSNLFSWGGFFLLFPLVAVHYVDNLGWAAGTIGVMLAVRQFSQQGLSMFFGMLCDRVGPKPLICAGQLVRAAGFGAMAFVDTPPTVLAAMALAGLGGAMFDAPKSAAMAYLTTPAERQRRYATLGVTSGIGVTLGTQFGALLIKQDFGRVALASGAVYLFLFVWNLVALPSMRVSTGSVNARQGLSLVWHDRDFMIFLLVTIGYFFASGQFSLTITLAAADIAGSTSAVAWIYLVNTAIVVGLGYFVPRWLERWFSPVDMLVWGIVVISIGLGMVGFSQNIGGVLLAAAVFSLGAILARPGNHRRQPGPSRGTRHVLRRSRALDRLRREYRVPVWRDGVRLRQEPRYAVGNLAHFLLHRNGNGHCDVAQQHRFGQVRAEELPVPAPLPATAAIAPATSN